MTSIGHLGERRMVHVERLVIFIDAHNLVETQARRLL